VRYALYGLIAIAAAAAGMWVSVSRQAGAPAATPASTPVAAPSSATEDPAKALFALSLPDLNNKPQSLNQWRGKVLVVNFWATWCAPCREEIPMFVKMQQKYQQRDLQIVGISIDQLDKTSEFFTNFGMNYPVLIGTFDTIDVSRKAGNARRVLPFTVVLDRKGQIVSTELGGLNQEKLEALIAPLL
jgi:thiol-disulfide isomerase/thioredoxin